MARDPRSRGGAVTGAPPRPERREFPFWAAALILLCLWLGWLIWRDEVYNDLFGIIVQGLWMTIYVTLMGFAGACALGLALALAQGSRWRVLREAARFYIELIRGVPLIVLLVYVALVLIPMAVTGYGELFRPLIDAGVLPEIRNRDLDLFWRAVAALMMSYGAFVAEIFRAGIDSVGRGQTEAARSLGLTGWQTSRLVVLPQALRVALPPLGNDFINMIKDSALVSAIGVADLAYMGRVASTESFRYFESYNIIAFLYLVMTLGLSFGLRALERRLARRNER